MPVWIVCVCLSLSLLVLQGLKAERNKPACIIIIIIIDIIMSIQQKTVTWSFMKLLFCWQSEKLMKQANLRS